MNNGLYYNDEIFPKTKNTLKALIDKTKIFKQGSTNNIISICFEKPACDNNNNCSYVSTSKIGTDSNRNVGIKNCTSNSEIYFTDKNGVTSLKKNCEMASMYLRWLDSPFTSFSWKGKNYDSKLFENDSRFYCDSSVICSNPPGGVILHEFLHALGALHEHSHSGKTFTLNTEKVYEAYCGTPDYKLDDDCVENAKFQIITNYSCGPMQNEKCYEATEYDPYSIMHYKLPDSFINGVNTTKENYKLSELDKKWLTDNYPIDSIEKPKIKIVFSNGQEWQKAWFEKVITENILPYAGIELEFVTEEGFAICDNVVSASVKKNEFILNDSLIIGGIVLGSVIILAFLAFLFMEIR